MLGRRAAARADQLALLERAVEDARERRDTAAGVEVARRMLELEPLHEEAHRALMWFLATGGQRRRPGPVRDLPLPAPGGAGPGAVGGRRHPARPDHPGGRFADLGPPPAAVAAAGARRAPRPLTSLIGREEDLARLHALLDDPACRLVTLVGPGGIGKTRLALEAGATRRGRYRDGVLTVSFVGTSRRGRRRRPTWW